MRIQIMFMPLVLLIWVFGAIHTIQAADPSTSSLVVRIVPTDFYEEAGRIIALYNSSQHFYVVLTNISQTPVNLWQEQCSWGYSTLAFEVTDENGDTTLVEKKPRAWRSNYPQAMLILPQEHFVFEVTFDATIWQNSPLPEKQHTKVVKMKAIYEVPEDEFSQEYHVWTGRITSPEETFTLYH